MTQDNNQVQAEALIEDDPIEVRQRQARGADTPRASDPYGHCVSITAMHVGRAEREVRSAWKTASHT